MANDQINVDVNSMLQAVQELEGKHDEIKRGVDGVHQDFDGLAASWQGDAATGFQNAMAGFYEDCQTVLNALVQLAQDVDTSARNYGQAHQQTVEAGVALQKTMKAQAPGLSGF